MPFYAFWIRATELDSGDVLLERLVDDPNDSTVVASLLIPRAERNYIASDLKIKPTEKDGLI